MKHLKLFSLVISIITITQQTHASSNFKKEFETLNGTYESLDVNCQKNIEIDVEYNTKNKKLKLNHVESHWHDNYFFQKLDGKLKYGVDKSDNIFLKISKTFSGGSEGGEAVHLFGRKSRSTRFTLFGQDKLLVEDIKKFWEVSFVPTVEGFYYSKSFSNKCWYQKI